MSGSNDAPVDTIESVSGTGIPVRGNDIDTDQIIPARFMKVVTFDGLGEFAFFDQRFDGADNEKDHPFNEEQFREANVLVVNANFGCGSSREHAPQALQRWGIDAVVGESFAEIFAGNCLALGIPTITASTEEIGALQAFLEKNPDAEIAIDVERELVTYGSGGEEKAINADVADAQHKALVEGVWDTTALMRANENAVRETADSLAYMESDD